MALILPRPANRTILACPSEMQGWYVISISTEKRTCTDNTQMLQSGRQSDIATPCVGNYCCKVCLHDMIGCICLCMRAHLLIVQRSTIQKSVSGRIMLSAGGVPLFLHHEERFTESMPGR